MITNNINKYKTILVTGGAGFIGGNLINHLLENTNSLIINLDKVSYASEFNKFASIKKKLGSEFLKRYKFLKIDLKNSEDLLDILFKFKPELIFNLAAESHVDRSIMKPRDFVDNNIIGTFNLLDSVRGFLEIEKNLSHFKFIHVSTDEVFGSLRNGYFNEKSPYKPNSPYAASKASSDHLVRSWNRTFDVPTIITNCSNNFGPWQFPEKLIPLTILNALCGKPITIYGNGENIRDWIYVFDHISGLISVAEKGEIGKTYCIGSQNNFTNNYIAKCICKNLDLLVPSKEPYSNLISYVPDRLGHDFRYAIDSNFIKNSIGWISKYDFHESLKNTVSWYVKNQDWCSDLIKR